MLMPRRTSVRGASLIEVVIVMVIMAVMLTYVMPELRDWMQNLKVRNAAESVKNGLEVARMEALRRNSRVGFWLVSDSAKVPTNACSNASVSAAWVVSVDDPAGACGADPSSSDAPRLVQRSNALENASGLTVSALDSTGASADRVIFNGLGQVQSVAGTPSIQTVDIEGSSGGSRRLRVVVEGGGAIRMCDRGVASSDPRACPAL